MKFANPRNDIAFKKIFGDESALRTAEGKGLKKGLEKGLEQGREEGKLEEKLEIARNLLKVGIDIENIIIATGLTKEEIEKEIR